MLTHSPFRSSYALREWKFLTQRRTQGGAGGLQPPKPPKTEIKNTDFVGIMISKVLRDFAFSRNQPLKLADD
jgi:hypothetical protein